MRIKGGMIQTQRRDGTWKDAFPVDAHRSIQAVENVGRKTKRPARLIARDGRVQYQTKED